MGDLFWAEAPDKESPKVKVKPTAFDDMLADAELKFGARSKQVASFKRAFGYGPTSISERPFFKSMEERFRNRMSIERSAAINQFTSESYTKLRTRELLDVAPDAYLAKEYGLRTAKNRGRQTGLKIDNDSSSNYNRDFPSNALDNDLKAVYCRAKGLDKLKSSVGCRLLFVNSLAAVAKLEAFYGKAGPYTMEELAPGVCALLFDNQGDCEKWRDGAMHIGATPNSHQAMKLALQGGAQAPSLAPGSLGNHDALAKLYGSDSRHPALALLADLPVDHPMKTVAQTAIGLVEGLRDKLSDEKFKADFDKNKLVADSLRSLKGVLNALPSCAVDSQSFTRLFEVMIDELYIVLASARPYALEDYKDGAQRALRARAPSLGTLDNVECSSFLASSGMDAVSSAVAAVLTQAGGADQIGDNGKGEVPDYFEIRGVLEHNNKLKGNSELMVATLNPSTPMTTGIPGSDDRWDAAKVVKTVKEKLKTVVFTSETKFTTLVLDITVECPAGDGKSDLETVIGGLKDEIESGALKLILCKSYQKYPSLGSGKIMAGGITFIGKKGDQADPLSTALADDEAALKPMESDEAQLLAHIVKHGADQELAMIKRAADNADFAQRFCAGGDQLGGGWTRFDPGLPFVIGASDPITFEGGSSGMGFADMCTLSGVEWRDSFGFLNTTSLYVPVGDKGGARITLGQDSRGEVVEKLYALGRLALGSLPIKMEGVKTGANAAANAAVTDVFQNAAPETFCATAVKSLEAWGVAVEKRQPVVDAWKALRAEIHREDGPRESELTELRRKMMTALTPVWTEAAEARPDGALREKLALVTTATSSTTADPTLHDATPEEHVLAINELLQDLADWGVVINPESEADKAMKALQLALSAGDKAKPEEIAALAKDLRPKLRKFWADSQPGVLDEAVKPLNADPLTLPKHLRGERRADSMVNSARLAWSGREDQPGPGEQTEYLQNILASYLNLAAVGFPTGDVDAIEPMFEALMATGMRQLSREARENVVVQWSKIAERRVQANDNVDATADAVAKHAKQLPNPESKGRFFQNFLNDDDFGKLPPEKQALLARETVGALDINARLALITSLVGNSNKLLAATADLYRFIAEVRDGTAQVAEPETLSSKGKGGGDASWMEQLPTVLNEVQTGTSLACCQDFSRRGRKNIAGLGGLATAYEAAIFPGNGAGLADFRRFSELLATVASLVPTVGLDGVQTIKDAIQNADAFIRRLPAQLHRSLSDLVRTVIGQLLSRQIALSS